MGTTRSSNFVEPHTRTLSIPCHKCIILSLNVHFHGKLMSDCDRISDVEDLKSKEEDRLAVAVDKWQLSIMKLKHRGGWAILAMQYGCSNHPQKLSRGKTMSERSINYNLK
ncbi:unnamed protein product [Citrullus colocynthis]|uniref:Uncharacterized protein n=1 Tax=Citrullus colocynthis TaxID=252529 RepID=A0ABP0Z6T4_9ROSI